MNKPTKTYNKTSVCSEWRLPNGDLHRIDGPAREYDSGTKSWHLNGKLHREDGPTVDFFDGDKYWYLNGKKYSEKEHKQIMRQKKLERILNG